MGSRRKVNKKKPKPITEATKQALIKKLIEPYEGAINDIILNHFKEELIYGVAAPIDYDKEVRDMIAKDLSQIDDKNCERRSEK